MANWKTWRGQSDLECLAKARYESKAFTLYGQIQKAVALLESVEQHLNPNQKKELHTIQIVYPTCNPFK